MLVELVPDRIMVERGCIGDKQMTRRISNDIVVLWGWLGYRGDLGMRAKNATNAVQNSHHELFYEARLAWLWIRLALIIAYHRFINCPQ